MVIYNRWEIPPTSTLVPLLRSMAVPHWARCDIEGDAEGEESCIDVPFEDSANESDSSETSEHGELRSCA